MAKATDDAKCQLGCNGALSTTVQMWHSYCHSEVSVRQTADATLRSQKLIPLHCLREVAVTPLKEGNRTQLISTLRRQRQGMGNLRQGPCTSEASLAICYPQHCLKQNVIKAQARPGRRLSG